MANVEPEISRMFRAFDSGNTENANKFRDRTITMIDSALSFPDISAGGHTEWTTLRLMINNYNKLDPYARKLVLSYGIPFSIKFAKQLQTM